MSGYRLADRSLSSDYKIGDEFEVVDYTGSYHIGDTVIADEIVRNIFYSGGCPIRWHWVKPTPETKRKVHYRKTGKWLVLEGDYVAHTDMTFKQFKEWCDAAKACGFRLDHVNTNVCVITFADEEGDLVSSWYTDVGAQRNTTEEFLEFLAKEERDMGKFKVGDKVKIRKDSKYYRDVASNPKDTQGEVKSINSCGLEIEVMWDNGFLNVYSESDLEFWFTKADLKDGMVVSLRDGRQGIVFDGSIERTFNDIRQTRMTNPLASTRCYRDDLKDDDGVERFDIMKVVDRDGTVLFERKEEPTELTLEEIAEKFGLPVERVRIKK